MTEGTVVAILIGIIAGLLVTVWLLLWPIFIYVRQGHMLERLGKIHGELVKLNARQESERENLEIDA